VLSSQLEVEQTTQSSKTLCCIHNRLPLSSVINIGINFILVFRHAQPNLTTIQICGFSCGNLCSDYEPFHGFYSWTAGDNTGNRLDFCRITNYVIISNRVITEAKIPRI
jgi:hypothetical protein